MSIQPIHQLLWDTLHGQPRFWPRWPSDEVIRWALSNLPNQRLERARWRVVDVGCGAGRHAIFFAELGLKSVGIDFSQPALDVGRSRAQERELEADFVCATATATPFSSASFDAALLWGVMYYGTLDFARQSVQELARILKPNGIALIMTRSPWDRRTAYGERVSDCTYVIRESCTNEAGFTMSFLDEGSLVDLCAPYFEITALELQERTVNMRTERDSDWLLTVRRLEA
jgi:SAM-dependent methyltransferase